MANTTVVGNFTDTTNLTGVDAYPNGTYISSTTSWTNRWPPFSPYIDYDRTTGNVIIRHGYEEYTLRLGELLKKLGMSPEQLMDVLTEELM